MKDKLFFIWYCLNIIPGIGMMEEEEPETPKSSDDVKTGFVKAAVEHIEKQSGIDAPGGYF